MLRLISEKKLNDMKQQVVYYRSCKEDLERTLAEASARLERISMKMADIIEMQLTPTLRVTSDESFNETQGELNDSLAEAQEIKNANVEHR